MQFLKPANNFSIKDCCHKVIVYIGHPVLNGNRKQSVKILLYLRDQCSHEPTAHTLHSKRNTYLCYTFTKLQPILLTLFNFNNP